MRQSEFKRKYGPEIGKYKNQHIWGGEISEVSKKTKKQVKFAPPPSLPLPPPLSKKAGDKIVKMLSKII